MAKGVTRQHLEALQKYNERLELINKQLQNLNKNSKEYKKLQAEKNKVIEKGAKAQKDLAAATGKLSSTLPNNKKLIDESAKAQKNWNNSTSTGTKVSKGFFGRLKTAIGTLTRYSIAYKAINLGQQLFNELVVNSAKRAIALEKALADVAAVANLTSSEMDRLERVVFKVAGSTSLTAIEVVELQKQLAKLGTSVSDIENLTQPVALLSQALGEDAGGVAASLKKTLNQFQATSEEADRFANALVGAINESALSLNDLGTALQYVGPLAAQSGLSFEQTASFIGILADNGFRASRAGTGLRNVILEASKDGRDFSDVLRDLAQRNLTVAEATELFGKRGAAAAIVLAKNIDRIEELNEELQDNTRLLKANAKQMSSTQGQIDLLSSAYNRASIRLGDYITQTEFFIELLEVLDPTVAGQARAFKVIANASEQTENSLDNLTNSLINFKETEEEAAISTSQSLFEVLKTSGSISAESAKAIERELEKGRDILDVMEKRAELLEYAEDELALAESLIEITGDRASQLRDLRILEEARNENYKEAEALTNRLTQSAKEGLLADQEQERVTKGLTQELKRLQQARENSSDVEEITVLEKRIALFEELKTTVENLENSQDAINKREKERIKSSLELTVQAIQDQQKVIEGLGDTTTKEGYSAQVEVLNALFGDLESLKNAAIARFGNDSEFAKFISDLFAETLASVQVAARPDPFGDITLDPGALLGFGEEDNVVTKIEGFKETIRKAFTFEEGDLGELIEDALNTASDAISNFNDTALENTRNSAEQQLDVIRNRYEIEEDIVKSQLDNQLITESQFRQKQIELRKAQVRDENDIEKKLFEAEKKRDRQNAGTDYLEAIASIIPTLIAYDKTADPVSVLTKAAITGALATAAYGAELSAIGQRKFFPKKFEQGGMVSGPSHSEGGVPFTVQGQGGYEMEGGEFIINKKATAMHRDLLERINNSYRTSPQVGRMKFAQGGLVNAPVNESVDYLKAIAEATTSTAIGVSKPVRAYVSDKDLRSNATERRIRERNDRL